MNIHKTLATSLLHTSDSFSSQLDEQTFSYLSRYARYASIVRTFDKKLTCILVSRKANGLQFKLTEPSCNKFTLLVTWTVCSQSQQQMCEFPLEQVPPPALQDQQVLPSITWVLLESLLLSKPVSSSPFLLFLD